MLRMTLLGVGTAVPDPDRENTHMVWESPEGLLLIDAGGSTFQRLLRANPRPAGAARRVPDPLARRSYQRAAGAAIPAGADRLPGAAADLWEYADAGAGAARGRGVRARGAPGGG